MNRKILIGISLMVVLIFLLQPVASIEVGISETNIDEKTSSVKIDNEVNTPEVGNEILDDADVIVRKVEPKFYKEQMEENREIMQKADPNAFIPEYDYDKIVQKYEPIDAPLDIDPSKVELVNNMEPKPFKFGKPNAYGKQSSSSTRAGPTDLEITQMTWETKKEGWGHYTDSEQTPGENPAMGGFIVGEKTTITVRVLNHNIANAVSNININWSVYDWYGGIPLIKIPTQVSFSVLPAQANTDVSFDFTPPAAKGLLLSAWIDYEEDTDTSNNGFGYVPVPVMIWASDFESGGYNMGSGSDTTWGGNIGVNDNEWHPTTTAKNQLSQDHTTTTSYYHGDESGGTDTYDDSLELTMESPKIDMGEISDGQDEAGILQDGYYYNFAVPTWAGLFTGEAEIPASGADETNTDILWTYEYTDEPDPPQNWKEPITKWLGGYLVGNWEMVFQGQTTPTWNPNIRFVSQTQATYGWPFALLVGDGSGGNQQTNGATNWSRCRFRTHFIGDNGGDTGTNLPGYYADDFVTWGYQKWLPPYNIRLTEISSVTQNDVPIIYPGMPTKFTVKVENMGEALSNVQVKITVKDSSGGTVHTDTKTIPDLPEDGEGEVTVTSWNPSGEGEFYIEIVAGDLTKDYTPTLNDWELKVYVRQPNGQILVVDDDNSMHNNGIFFKDVEVPMLQSLDDLEITYNVYSVGWNETGPTKAIMDNYDVVIWLTGLDNEYNNYGTNPTYGSNWGITFKPEDQTEISNFLNDPNKNIWIISPGALYDLTNTEGATSPTGFLKDYMHIIYCNANETEYNDQGDITKRGTPTVLIGESGTLAANANYDTYGSEPPGGFGDIGGIIEGDTKAKTVFFQNTARTAYNSLQYSENFNLVYFAFNYYLIPDAADRKDLTYRVLNFFGLVGGVDLDRDDDAQKKIRFGQTVSFKFKITNLGLMDETMNIKLVSPDPANIPEGWTVELNDESPSLSSNEMTVAGNLGVKYFYLNVTAPETYLDNDGNMDPDFENTSADSVIQFKVRVESKNYPDNFYDHSSCKVVMGLEGHVKLTPDKTSDTIDISTDPADTDHYVEYSIYLRNVTNGDEDFDVMVTIDNPTAIQADVLQAGTVITDTTITLVPRMDQEVTVRVTADEHEPMGDYAVTFKVMDEDGEIELNSTVLTTTVKQYFDLDIKLLESETYSRIVDPNAMTTSIQTEEFLVTIENYGNGEDTVTLEWNENKESPNVLPIDWETTETFVEIYEEDGSDTIDEIDIPAFDKVAGTPGTVTVEVHINIPQEDEEGRYWIDLKATSSAPRSYINNLVREDDFLVEVNTTFQVEMISPELKFDTEQSFIEKPDGTKYIDQVDTIYDEDKIGVTVVVTNDGTAPVTDVTVELQITLDNVPVNTYQETVNIAAGESENITWPFQTDGKGMYYFKVKIDPGAEVLGDNPQDNTWNVYLNVKKKEKDDGNGNGPTTPFTSDKEGGTNTTLLLIVIVIIIIIIVVVLLIFFMQKKKSEEEIEDITMIGGPMGGPPGAGMPPAGMPGMGMPPAGPGMGPPKEGAMAPGTSPEMKALSPSAPKQLPPAAAGGKTCSSCGEKNPLENKFCQGCGGKL